MKPLRPIFGDADGPDDSVIEALAWALKEAQAGQITGLVLVTVSRDDEYSFIVRGSAAPLSLLGCLEMVKLEVYANECDLALTEEPLPPAVK
jgi:hypothetical protein